MSELKFPSSAIKEAAQSGKTLKLTSEDLPWIDEPIKVPLTLVELFDGKKFYLGSAVRGKELINAADALDRDDSDHASQQLINHLPDFFQNGSRDIYNVEVPKSIWPTYYVKVSGGNKLRTFFIRTPDVDKTPVVVKIASCNKYDEMKVLKVITNTRHQR